MTILTAATRPTPRPAQRAWLEIGLIVVGLGAVVVARAAATRAGFDALAVGAGFGAALLGLSVASGSRIELGERRAAGALVGVGAGLALVGFVLAGAWLGGASSISGLARPASPFLPWASITIVVAVGEEVLLRGLLFDRLRRAGGTPLALLATTVLFALLHVPMYGWHVVPLDVAVGLALGGLRVATRGIVAPSVAHVVADLATWWL